MYGNGLLVPIQNTREQCSTRGECERIKGEVGDVKHFSQSETLPMSPHKFFMTVRSFDDSTFLSATIES
jgi:hypothetical protein